MVERGWQHMSYSPLLLVYLVNVHMHTHSFTGGMEGREHVDLCTAPLVKAGEGVGVGRAQPWHVIAGTPSCSCDEACDGCTEKTTIKTKT